MKTLLAQIEEYKTAAILAPIFTVFEVLMEVLIPFVTASIIDKGIEAGDIRQVYFYGGIMLVMALLSSVLGVLAGRYAAKASSGLACNLRESIYEKVQTFAFSNIDKFSTAGLVTRMTTDVTNVQNAAQMILRVAVRAPLVMICSMVMCFFISAELSTIFLVAILILAAALIFIMVKTTKVFNEVFRKYDDLNASVQENVSAIRVVKAFVREEYENSRFGKAAEKLYSLFVKAESNLALNNPVMMLVVYGCILAISWFGARFIVAGDLTTGNLTSLFSYVMSVLMSLMMFSMVFVMITMSAASGRRIAEVLNEVPDMNDPDRPETGVRDGSIDFNHVNFSYKHGSGKETLHDIDFHIHSGETVCIRL
ncbi:MAG TPA: ABC transporter ATP-binding protein [Candidatus Eisenbergiella pullicola]|nr:ABC transporter ATP-binding protein [Candidatus Eisenbergiella pullicola]